MSALKHCVVYKALPAEARTQQVWPTDHSSTYHMYNCLLNQNSSPYNGLGLWTGATLPPGVRCW